MVKLLGEERKFKKIIITARDEENNLENLINYIKQNTDPGHCSTIIIDATRTTKEGKKTFEIDGDGSDKIYSIEVEDYKEVDDK